MRKKSPPWRGSRESAPGLVLNLVHLFEGILRHQLGVCISSCELLFSWGHQLLSAVREEGGGRNRVFFMSSGLHSESSALPTPQSTPKVRAA